MLSQSNSLACYLICSLIVQHYLVLTATKLTYMEAEEEDFNEQDAEGSAAPQDEEKVLPASHRNTPAWAFLRTLIQFCDLLNLVCSIANADCQQGELHFGEPWFHGDLGPGEARELAAQLILANKFVLSWLLLVFPFCAFAGHADRAARVTARSWCARAKTLAAAMRCRFCTTAKCSTAASASTTTASSSPTRSGLGHKFCSLSLL